MSKILRSLFIFMLLSNTLSAATWYVRVGGNGDGTTTTTAFGTITAAIAAASEGDIIDIGPGTFAERFKITKSLELKGSNAGNPFWNWSQPATIIIPPSTTFESAAISSLAYVEANGVKIDGILFDGVNNSLSDAPARVINGKNARSGWGIAVAADRHTLSFENNKLQNFTSRGIFASTTDLQNSVIKVKDNVFENITGVNNVLAIAVLTTNYIPEITGNRVTHSNFGILLQYTATPAGISGEALVQANRIEAHILGIAVRGFNSSLSPELLIKDNTIDRIDYDLWSAEGLTTKPTQVEFTGMDFSALLGDKSINIENNIINEARSAIYIKNVAKSALNTDRILIKNNTHSRNRFGLYIDDASLTDTRVVVESTTVRDTKVSGMQVQGHGNFENELVLRNGVIIDHPAPLTDGYANGIYLTGAKAVLGALNDTRIGSALYSFISFHENAMASKEVDGSNVTYDGTVSDYTFHAYKPSATVSAALRAAVKQRIQDGNHENHAGSGKVTIAEAANTTWYVRLNANGAGTAPQNAFGTITAAIAAAANGDIVNIGSGTFVERFTINKSLELRGANHGDAPWNWSNAATIVRPPSTEFINTASNFLARVTADDVKINGIRFDGTNDALNDAPPREGNGQKFRAQIAIVVPGTNGNLHFVNNEFAHFSQRAIGVSSPTNAMYTNPVHIQNNSFDNMPNAGWAVFANNCILKMTGNRITRCYYGLLLQYNATPNVLQDVNIADNQISAYGFGISVGGFTGGIAPALIVKNNTVSRADFATWSPSGITKPAGNELEGIMLSFLLGENPVLVENNTVDDARDGILIRTVPKLTANPDRLLIKSNTLTNNMAGIYFATSFGTDSRAVVDATVIRDSKIVGIQVDGISSTDTPAQYISELVLQNGVLIDHPAAITTEYNDAIYLNGDKAVLAELNDTKISKVKFNFITFQNNAMAGREVDGNDVTYDGEVHGFTFNNYKPSATTDVALRTAVKERIKDGEDATHTGSGIVRIATITGIQPLEQYAGVEVYPNPSTNGTINISLSHVKGNQVNVVLYSNTGQKVLEQTAAVKRAGVHLQLATGSLPKGLYLLQLTDGQAVSTRKVILE